MSGQPRHYSPELRAEVVRAVLHDGRLCSTVAKDFGLVPDTVRAWVRIEKKLNAGNTSEARDAIDRAHVKELERRVRELEEENAFLKKATRFFAQLQP
jgi:transposase